MNATKRISELFARSKAGQALVKQEHQRQEATRRETRAALDRVNDADLAGVKQRSPGIQNCRDELTNAVRVVEERKQALARDLAHDRSERYLCEVRIDRLEQSLRETADPRILEFIERMNGELSALRGWDIASSEEPTGTIERSTGAEIMARHSEAMSLGRRLKALREATEAAKALQLEIIDNVPKSLAEIEDKLPAIVTEKVTA